MKIFLSRSFFRIGDIEYNADKIIKIYDEALKDNCDLLILPEMSITGFPVYEELNDKNFLKKSNDFVEKIIDYTKGKKTRMLLGCPYSVDEIVKQDGTIQKQELFNSVILIDNGYINGVHNKSNIAKNNLFDEYKYFDKDVILCEISYENDNFDVLIGDEIDENKNILYIKERDTDFIVCLDTELAENMDKKKKQLSKIAKWTGKNIIYMNSLSYDYKKMYRFLGEIFIINKIGDIEYFNLKIDETLIKFETKIIDGELKIQNIDNNKKDTNNFIDIIAKNYQNKKIVVETNKDLELKEKNIIQITFDETVKNKNIHYINIDDYIKNITITREIKKILLSELYKDAIIIL